MVLIIYPNVLYNKILNTQTVKSQTRYHNIIYIIILNFKFYSAEKHVFWYDIRRIF